MLFLESFDERRIGISSHTSKFSVGVFLVHEPVNATTASRNGRVTACRISLFSFTDRNVSADPNLETKPKVQNVGGVFTHSSRVSARPGFFH